jgi:hypothetical protein
MKMTAGGKTRARVQVEEFAVILARAARFVIRNIN